MFQIVDSSDHTERPAFEPTPAGRERETPETVMDRAEVTLDSIGDAVLATDVAGRVTYLNREAELMTGWSRGDAAGRMLPEVFRIIDGTTRGSAPDPARRAMEEGRKVGLALGCVLVRRDGSEVEIEDSAAPIYNRGGLVTGAVIVFHDALQSRSTIEKLAHLAWHDPLTGLPNISLLAERLDQAVGQARRRLRQVAVLFLDVDDFKQINDAYGHMVGDELLIQIGSRLGSCVRTTDTICRKGGDEFVVLLPEVECRRDAASVAAKVSAGMAEPFLVDDREIRVRVSLGMSIFPQDGADAAQLMRCADAAMYRMKAGVAFRFWPLRARAGLDTHQVAAGDRI